VRQPLFSIIATPGEKLRIGLAPYAQVDLSLTIDGKAMGERADSGWLLAAPSKPGLYRLRIARTDNDDESLLQLWVVQPIAARENETLNGYKVGKYPPPRANRANYDPPAGMIEVTLENIDSHLSTHFTLRQFVCKQASGYPKYVVVQESLLLLLERLLAEVQSSDFDVETFGIISGYRTPWYNRSIGNVQYSRHVYGDAMDIFVDADGDGRMDDLNRDGVHDMADIKLFYDMVDALKALPENVALVGGVGRYRRNSRHGGFVHVDTRGYRARW
jgi:Peptidase M15